MILVHGTCVALDGAAVLLRGPSGSGKSDLALRLIEAGAHLVADDQVVLTHRLGALIAAAPQVLAGRLEVRGVGIVAQPHVSEARVALVIDLVASAEVERMPERATVELIGMRLPLIKLNAFEASAVAKIRLALGMSDSRLAANR
jgi:HPr kinase/phosphorylase